MTFVYPILLGGLVLVGVPILLHLILRQKPRRLRFPAFRFLVKRHRTNLRKLQLRHLLLLALRILLIAAICLALARPKLFHTELNLSSDRPVAAVFIIDTSYSMEYRTSDKKTRLDEAKQRALELLNELPDGSRVAILDSAETMSTRGNWQTSTSDARQRVNSLGLTHANAPLNASLLTAYRMFAELARNAEDEPGRQLPRFLCIFSDRMRACWDGAQEQLLHEAHDQVPPLFEGLQQLRGDVPVLVTELGELRKKLPPPTGRDYAEQSLIDSLQKLAGRIPDLQRDDLATDQETAKYVSLIRRGCREILGTIQQLDPKKAKQEYLQQIVDRLQNLWRQVQGAYGIFVDVGVGAPADLAILEMDLPRGSNGQPRQAFNDDEKLILRVAVQATGTGFKNVLVCQLGGHSVRRDVSLKGDEKTVVPLEFDFAALAIKPGLHQLEGRLAATDALPFNNTRYLTFAIREPQHILVLTDAEAKADYFRSALEAQVVPYRVDVKLAEQVKATQELLPYDAIWLLGVARPEPTLWHALESYVQQGGGVGVAPAGADLQTEAYNDMVAQKLLPAKLEASVDAASKTKEKGAAWDLNDEAIFQHPLLRPFRDWRHNQEIDFIRFPRRAFRYWQVKEQAREGPLVRYAESKDPALLERRFPGGGRVLLFTTTFDAQKPEWNNYLDSTTSIYVVLTGLATRYLAGELEDAQLNFECGRDVPTVKLPPDSRYPDYALQGPVFDRSAGGAPVLRLEKANKPGNYVVQGVKNAGDNGKEVARFSVNMPSSESDLSRAPESEIESVLGPRSVTTVERRAKIRDVLQGHFNEPLELFPLLMVLLLIVMAVENLLANRFYKREEGGEGREV